MIGVLAYYLGVGNKPFKGGFMTRLYIIIGLVVVSTLYAWNNGCDTKNKELKLFGLNSKVSAVKPEDGKWRYIPCNGTTKNCGRLK
jgi:hypothetical protein